MMSDNNNTQGSEVIDSRWNSEDNLEVEMDGAVEPLQPEINEGDFTDFMKSRGSSSKLSSIILYAITKNITDIHLISGKTPVFRVGRISTSVVFSEFEDIVNSPARFKLEILDEVVNLAYRSIYIDSETKSRAISEFDLQKCKSARFTFPIEKTTVRCSLLLTKGRPAVAIRIQPRFPRSLASPELGFTPSLQKVLTSQKTGLYLIAGGPSCGKSSTLASIVQEWVLHSDYHIRVLENPIEYLYKEGSGLLTQQWVHPNGDINNYADAVEDCLTQDVNIIAFGELRDAESIKQAIFASTLNMVVVATLHAPDAIGAIRRILEAYPPGDRDSALKSLQSTLQVIVSQKFVANTEEITGVSNSKILGKNGRLSNKSSASSVKLDYESYVFSDSVEMQSCLSNQEKLKELEVIHQQESKHDSSNQNFNKG